MISKWNYHTLTSEEEELCSKLSEELNINRSIMTLLIQRGINTPEAVKKYFRPQLNDLHDPFLMRDMDKAVMRLNQAIGRKENILIYGDYDVDGTTAVALVYRFLRNFYNHQIGRAHV